MSGSGSAGFLTRFRGAEPASQEPGSSSIGAGAGVWQCNACRSIALSVYTIRADGHGGRAVTVHQQIRRKLTLLVGFSSATFGGFTTFVVVAPFPSRLRVVSRRRRSLLLLVYAEPASPGICHTAGCTSTGSAGTQQNARTPGLESGALGFPCAAGSRATHRMRTMGTLARLALVRKRFLRLGSNRGRDRLQLDLLVAGSGGRRRR